MRLRDAACEYAAMGWAVLPLRTRAKQPAGSLVPQGLREATSDLATVLSWWEKAPRANIGIACQQSGLVALDIDPRNGGFDSLVELERELGTLPRTLEAESGGGGAHILFVDEQTGYRKELAPGVDIKANGYIVAPPSLHPSGKPYVWDVDGDPSEAELARLPERWWNRMTVQTRAHTPVRDERTTDVLKWIPAEVYAPILTGRPIDDRGWLQCPFHRGGNERTPSFQASGYVWVCYACEPIAGKRMMGGDIYDLAALLWGKPIPLSGLDFAEVRAKLKRTFS